MRVDHTRDAVLRRNNVRVTGRAGGQVMVFAHGFGCSQATWNLVAPQFEADYRVVLFDYVGAGGSDSSAYDRGRYDSLDGYADDLLEILQTLNARDVIFVGQSVSAMVGMLAAARDAARFAHLILIGPSPRYVNDGDYSGGFEPSDIAALLDALDANYFGWSSSMAPVIMGNPDQPELGQRLTASFCSIDPDIARQFARVTFLSDNRADLEHVSTPTLVLQCSADPIAPLHVGRFVHDSIPGSTLAVLETTGHVPILSGADEVVARMRAYLP